MKLITAITIQGSHRELRWVTQFQIKYLKGRKWLTYDKADGSQVYFDQVLGVQIPFLFHILS